MSFWQYNAWCEAYKDRNIDQLSLQIQAAYLGAYWNGAQKRKKSLNSVLKSLRKDNTKIKRTPINLEKVSKEFQQVEELRNYGWTQK